MLPLSDQQNNYRLPLLHKPVYYIMLIHDQRVPAIEIVMPKLLDTETARRYTHLFTLKNVLYKEILKISELTIDARKTTCIQGESGSGKTTLLKLLNRLIDCQQGLITYRGKDLKTLDPVLLRREVVLLPQTPIIFPGTIKDNLLIGLFFAKKAPVFEQRLLEEMRNVALSKSLNEEADSLSGGEKQRLVLARVLLMEPEVLLLDEPTSALDEDTEKKIGAYINSYIKSGQKTLVLVTHSRYLTENMGDKIVTLKNGMVTDAGEAVY